MTDRVAVIEKPTGFGVMLDNIFVAIFTPVDGVDIGRWAHDYAETLRRLPAPLGPEC